MHSRIDISLLRISATLAVILLHTCNTISNNADNYELTKNQMLFFISVNYLMNWAVPVFLMITGVLFLEQDKVVTYNSCITKYSKRILLALVFFGIPFSMLENIAVTKRISISLIPTSIINVLTGNSWSHLWYLYTLIGIYMVLPVLKAFVDRNSRNDMKILLVILFILNFIIPIINEIFDITIAFEIPISSFAIFYVLLGKYLYDKTPKAFNNKKHCAIILTVCVGILFLANSFTASQENDYFGYGSPLIALISVLIFVLFKGVNPRMGNKLWHIDRLCFGVYLIHPVYINVMYKFFKISPVGAGKLYPLAVVLFWIFFVVCSFATSKIMHLIRPLKKYVL